MEAILTALKREPLVDDFEDLRAFAVEKSEDAFRNLVDRHSPYVYGACLRRLNDPNLAEDATQATFIVLAKKASKLKEQTVLLHWLSRTAKYICHDIVRTQSREQAKINEFKEVKMRESGASDFEMTMHIEQAMDKLTSDVVNRFPPFQ